MCDRYNVSGFPTLKLLTKDSDTPYEGPREANDILSWAESIAVEIIVPIEKADLKKDVKQRGLKAYFVLYAPKEQMSNLSKLVKRQKQFTYTIESEQTKLVAY